MIPPGIGSAARAERAKALDAWLATLLPRRTDPGVALVAVGGLGRGECAPYSDLDLLLLHDDHHNDLAELGTAIWYPIWDARFALDQSTRSVGQALQVAGEDLKVALGLLDARLIAGDPALFDGLRAQVLAGWRKAARHRLPQLADLTRQRWQTHGELAFLLEGDVKESRGGLRDFGVLRGLGYAGVAHTARPTARAAHRLLLDVRDAMHTVRGRRVDRLLAQDREEVGRLLGFADADETSRRVAEAARTTAHAVDDALRATERWITPGPGRSGRRPLARDVVEHGGEGVIARKAITPRPDPSLSLRVAAAAARADLPIARGTLEWLSAYAIPLPVPWPTPARDALFTLLGSGIPLVATWEACDRYGLVTGWFPEWARVRSLPQHNPVHLYTVDRHLIETTRQAAGLTREVDRPDLLLFSAFVHDIGKGLPGDHSLVGAPIAESIARRIGLPASDVAVVGRIVRRHLLIPDTATRRDLRDPATITGVADAVLDSSTLAILHALAKADARATGPAAWSTWKGRLIAELVNRVDAVLDTGVVPEPSRPVLPRIAPGDLPRIRVAEDGIEVIAVDRIGLLAAVAGCLALHRLDVVAADTVTVKGVARLACAVQPRFGGAPDQAALVADLRRAALGELEVAGRLAARDRRWSPGSTRPQSVAPRVRWLPATGAAILELRAADSLGLLYRVARALGEAGADVRATRISTLGADAVDAFYLVGEWQDQASREAVEVAVLAAAGGQW
jgi:[protein-PII] uridylyltransferase